MYYRILGHAHLLPAPLSSYLDGGKPSRIQSVKGAHEDDSQVFENAEFEATFAVSPSAPLRIGPWHYDYALQDSVQSPRQEDRSESSPRRQAREPGRCATKGR